VFTISFFVNIGLRTFDIGGEIPPLSPARTLTQLIGFTVLPLAIGMIIRAAARSFAERALEPIRKSVLYLMICVLVLAAVASYQTISRASFRPARSCSR
jgi:bile acid:Na+ symporter, BASS family